MADDLQIRIGAEAGPAVSGVNNVNSSVQALENTLRSLQTPLASISNRFEQLAQKENAAAEAARRSSEAARRAASDAEAYSRTFAGRVNAGAQAIGGFASSVNGAVESLFSFKNLVTGFALYQVTTSAISLGGALVNASMEMQALENRMRSAVGSDAVAAASMKYVREEAERLGLRFDVAASNYASFSAAALRSGLTIGQTQRVFTGVSEAAAAMGLTAQRQELVFQALAQMASKGTVSMEELRQQMGESLPGALQIFATAMGVSTSEFMKMVTAGQVLTPDLVKLGDEMHNQFGVRAVEASKNAQGEVNRFKNAIFDFTVEVGKATGITDGFTSAVRTLTGWFRGLTDVLKDPETMESLKEYTSLLGKLAMASMGGGIGMSSLVRGINSNKQAVTEAVKGGPVDRGTGGSSAGTGADLFKAMQGESYTMGTVSPPAKSGSAISQYNAELQNMLYSQQKFGKDAEELEAQFWAKKLTTAKVGTDEYNAIVAKVYATQQNARNQEIQDFVAANSYKQSLATDDFAEQLRLENEKLDFLRRFYREDSAEYQNVLREKERMVIQHNKQIDRENKKLEKDYQQTFMNVAKSFNTSIRGMLQGTMTFRDAMANIALDIVMFFVEAVEKMVAEWIAGQIIKVATTNAANAAETASTTGAIAAQGAAQTLYQGKSIMGSAATTYAGVFANMSPALGPFAAIPAGAAAALVAAQAALLPSFAVGAWELPGDTMAQVHQGEMIIPKPFAQSIRENGGFAGGGGGNMTVQISAVDARSVARLFRNNGGALTQALRQQARNADRNLNGLKRGSF